MSVIVNCDDFGYSNAVNEAIVDLLERGVATSATIIANGPAFPSAAEFARENQDRYSFGVHLNLSEFTPCSSATLDPLIDEAGEFAGRKPGCMAMRPALGKAILQEFEAQVERCVESGLEPTHFDSHYHIHYSPCLIPIIRTLGSKFDVRRIRPTMNRYLRDERPGRIKLVAKKMYNAGLGFVGFDSPDAMSDPMPLLEQLETGGSECTRGVWECMIHPGNSNAAYSDEVEAWERGVEEHGAEIELISYDDL